MVLKEANTQAKLTDLAMTRLMASLPPIKEFRFSIGEATGRVWEKIDRVTTL
jgi:hypothetical protein